MKTQNVKEKMVICVLTFMCGCVVGYWLAKLKTYWEWEEIHYRVLQSLQELEELMHKFKVDYDPDKEDRHDR